jgi:hypothetical protein
VPATAFPPCVKVKVLDEMLEAVIASLKVAVTVELMATPVAPLVGVTEVTVGGVGGVDEPHPAIRNAAENTAEASKKPNLCRMWTPLRSGGGWTYCAQPGNCANRDRGAHSHVDRHKESHLER